MMSGTVRANLLVNFVNIYELNTGLYTFHYEFTQFNQIYEVFKANKAIF